MKERMNEWNKIKQSKNLPDLGMGAELALENFRDDSLVRLASRVNGRRKDHEKSFGASWIEPFRFKQNKQASSGHPSVAGLKCLF